MSASPLGTLLQKRRYSEELQHRFAQLSGDFNPMHVDPVAARRTLVGELAVHGMHQVLAALEAILAKSAGKSEPQRAISGFAAQFLKPVVVGDVVSLYLSHVTAEGCYVIGRINGEAVSRVSIQFGADVAISHIDLPPLPHESVRELVFDELAHQSGTLPLGLDTALANQLFPLTTVALGTVRVAEILALSRLVGMRCPGLHSIFGKASVHFKEPASPELLHYRVEKADELYRTVMIEVKGPQLQGQLLTFFRPPPQPQPDMAEVTQRVKPGSFAESVALIVGGSRGLGEITAKIIAAGGGLPIITYHQGKSDAERVVAAIRASGGRCEMLRLNVERGQQVVRKLGKGKNAPKSLDYFATPKIPGRQRGFFDHDMLLAYHKIYVTAFGQIVEALAETCAAKIRVFYPSTVFVTEPVEKMEEYAMAKRLAEELCAFYNQHSKKFEVVVERLPRMKTDQTSAIIPQPAENALDVMLPLVSRMETFSVRAS